MQEMSRKTIQEFIFDDNKEMEPTKYVFVIFV